MAVLLLSLGFLENWKKMIVSSTSRGFCITGGRRHLKRAAVIPEFILKFME